MGACLSRPRHDIEIIQLKDPNHGSKDETGLELQHLSNTNDVNGEPNDESISSKSPLQSPKAEIDAQLEVEEILIEAFYLSGNLKLYLLNKTALLNEFKDIIELISTSKVDFCGFLYRKMDVSNNIAIKIYESLQCKKNDLDMNHPEKLKSMDVDDIDESRLQIIEYKTIQSKELNTINMNFTNGRYDKICNKYEVTLNQTDVKFFNPKTNTITLRIDDKNVNKFMDINTSPKMNNPLVVLLGISEFKEIDCDRLIGVKYDMIACRRLFQEYFGYAVFPYSDDWRYGKQYWSNYDIKDLFETVIRRELINCENGNLLNKFDGVIVIISTYINSNKNIIYSSDEHPIYLYDIFKKFDSDYQELNKIPRLFIIDGKSVCIEEYKEEKIMEDNNMYLQPIIIENKQHKKIENNSLKLLYRNNNIESEINFQNDKFYYSSDDGHSLFITRIICEFKRYFYEKPYKYNYFTETLNEILSNIELNIHKNGDLKLNELKFMKKNKKYVLKYEYETTPPASTPGGMEDVYENSDNDIIGEVNRITIDGSSVDDMLLSNEDSKQHIEYDEYKNIKRTQYEINMEVVVRIYRNILNKIIDVSKYSMKEIQNEINKGKIYEDLPLNGIICEINMDKNNNTLYLIKLNGIMNTNQSIWVKLRSIYGKEFCNELIFGKEIEAQKHRYIKILVMNTSENDILELLNENYMEKCNYLIQPKYINILPNGYHCYYIIGEIDKLMYESKAENGCLGIIQYKVKSNDNINENEMIILCGFRNIDKKNQWKNLQCPIFDCKYVNKNKMKNNVFKKMIKKLSDNKPKNNSRISCRLDNNDSNCIVYIFK